MAPAASTSPTSTAASRATSPWTRSRRPPTLALANDTGASSSDRITSDPTLASTPSAPGDTLLYALDGGVLSSAAPTITTDGQHTGSVVEQDTAGNVSATASLTFTLDTSVPVAPVIPVVPVNPPPPVPTIALTISGVSDAADRIGGYVVSGSLDTAQAGLAITIRDGADLLGTVASDADSRFAFSLATSTIGRIYADTLGQPADDVGLAFWDDLLDHGTSRATVAGSSDAPRRPHRSRLAPRLTGSAPRSPDPTPGPARIAASVTDR